MVLKETGAGIQKWRINPVAAQFVRKKGRNVV